MAQSKKAAASFTRRRGVVIGAAIVAMALAAGGGWLAIGAMPKEAVQMNLLPIRNVTFVGDLRRVDRDELKHIAGGIQAVGGGMLRTDLNQVKALVRQVEWVRDADVRRRFPGTLEIQIEEHIPFARWQTSGVISRGTDDGEQSLLVNRFGEVFEAETNDKLPQLAGPAGTSRDVMTQWVAFGKQLEPLGQTLAELRLSPRRSWQLKLDNGSTLALGRNEAAERLARFVRAYARVPALQAVNARVDLRYSSGLAVRTVHAMPIDDGNAARKPGQKS